MPDVRVTGGERDHDPLPTGPDPDRRVGLLHGPGPIGDAMQLVVATLEPSVVLRHQEPDQLHALFEALHPLTDAGEGEAELLMLLFVPRRAQRELQATRRDLVDASPPAWPGSTGAGT